MDTPGVETAENGRTVGIMHLAAKQRYGYTTKGTPLYRFTPLLAPQAPEPLAPPVAPGGAASPVATMAAVAPIFKVGYRHARKHASRNVYAVVELPAEVGGCGGGARANLVEVLGELLDPSAGMLAIQYAHVGYKRPRWRAPSATIEEDDKTTPPSAAACPGPHICCTIDPPGCVDVDDALGFRCATTTLPASSAARRHEEYEISVSITDVDAAVPQHTAVDAYYQRQPVSLYRPDNRVAHALPPALSTDACSLRAGKPRPVLSVHFRVRDDGALIASPRIARETICSQAQLTYTEANALLEDRAPPRDMLERSTVRSSDVVAWRALWPVFGAVLRRWMARVPALQLQGADAAHRAVEFLMIKANEHVARALMTAVQARRAPAVLLREHRPREMAPASAGNGDGDQDDNAPPSPPRRLCEALERLRGNVAARYVVYEASAAGNVAPPAGYAGHTGLGTEWYTHFTSPIRRYADLAVHRMVKAYLIGEDGGETPPPPYDAVALRSLAEHLNAFGRRAHRVASEWRWWHQRQPRPQPGSEVMGVGETDGALYRGYVLDWDWGDDAHAATSAPPRATVSLLARLARVEDEEQCDDDAALARGATVWIPLVHASIMSALSIRARESGSRLELRRKARPGECLCIQQYQAIAVRGWWDPKRGVKGRRFQWCEPNVGAFLCE